MNERSGESWCVECNTIVHDDHAHATKYHHVLHVSLFPAYRQIKEELENLKSGDCHALLCENGAHYYCERPKLHDGPHGIAGLKAWY